jgi:hypothetical protein
MPPPSRSSEVRPVRALRIPAFFAALLCAACGVTKTSVQRLTTENAQTKAELEATRDSLGPIEQYVAALRAGGYQSGVVHILFTPADVARGIASYFPYEFGAGVLISGATGTLSVSNVAGLQFLSRNRLRLRMFFNGRGIGYSKPVPKAYAADVQRVKEGVEAGVWADLEAIATYNRLSGDIVVRATCTDVNLTRNNTSTYRSQIKQYINAKMLDRPIFIKAPAINGTAPSALFDTGNHFVVEYRL